MNGLGERIAARGKALDAALAVITAERSIGTDEKGVVALIEAETAFELAARDLTNAIDDLPPNARPKGWATSPGGESA